MMIVENNNGLILIRRNHKKLREVFRWCGKSKPENRLAHYQCLKEASANNIVKLLIKMVSKDRLIDYLHTVVYRKSEKYRNKYVYRKV